MYVLSPWHYQVDFKAIRACPWGKSQAGAAQKVSVLVYSCDMAVGWREMASFAGEAKRNNLFLNAGDAFCGRGLQSVFLVKEDMCGRTKKVNYRTGKELFS